MELDKALDCKELPATLYIEARVISRALFGSAMNLLNILHKSVKILLPKEVLLKY